ncbi:MFS transporter, partial [bacterium]|nr:MFS transporter [bacterium]
MTSNRRFKEFFTLYLIVATELIGFGLIIPILPQLAYQLEQNRFMMGLLLAAYSLAQFVAAPILGSLSDKYGRKPILVISKLGSVAAYAILAVATNYWMFFLSRLLDGFTGGNISAARAYAADITSEEDRPKGMAIIGIAFGTGFILGPALGGFLYGLGNQGHVIAAWTAGLMSFLALLLTIFLLKEPERRNVSSTQSFLPKFREAFSNRSIQLICAAQAIYMILFSAFESTFSVYTFETFRFTEKTNSLIFLYIGLLALVVQGTITRRAPKNLRLVTILGFVIAAVGFMAIHLAYVPIYLLAAL